MRTIWFFGCRPATFSAGDLNLMSPDHHTCALASVSKSPHQPFVSGKGCVGGIRRAPNNNIVSRTSGLSNGLSKSAYSSTVFLSIHLILVSALSSGGRPGIQKRSVFGLQFAKILTGSQATISGIAEHPS